jgi:hypothetical protein
MPMKSLAQPPRVAARAFDDAMTRLGTALGCTPGQAYTLAVGFALAVVLAVTGLPPTVREITNAAAPRPAPRVAEPPPPPAAEPGQAAPAIGPSDQGAPRFDDMAGIFTPFPQPEIGDVPDADDEPTPPLSTFAAVAGPGKPEGIAVGPDGSVYVALNGDASAGASKILRFSATGARQGEIDIVGQPPVRTVGLTGLAMAGEKLVVLDASSNRVIEVEPATGDQLVRSVIPDILPCPAAVLALPVALPTLPCEHGETDHAPLLRGVAVASNGRVYVADEGQRTMWALGAENEPTFLHSGDYATGPSGVAVQPAGVLFTATMPGEHGQGAVLRLRLNPDSSVAGRELVAGLDGRSRPMGLALGADDRLHVALSAVDAFVVLDGEGIELARGPEGSGTPFDGPVGVALRGSSLLLTTQPASGPGSIVAVDLSKIIDN